MRESWHAGLVVFGVSFGLLGMTSVLIDAIWGEAKQDAFDKRLLRIFSVRVSHVATTYIWSYFLGESSISDVFTSKTSS